MEEREPDAATNEHHAKSWADPLLELVIVVLWLAALGVASAPFLATR